jgi:hypothetical protein
MLLQLFMHLMVTLWSWSQEVLCFRAIMQVWVSVTLFLNMVLLSRNMNFKVYRPINFACCFVCQKLGLSH